MKSGTLSPSVDVNHWERWAPHTLLIECWGDGPMGDRINLGSMVVDGSKTQAVTMGSLDQNDIRLPEGEGIPPRVPLFLFQDGRWSVCCTGFRIDFFPGDPPDPPLTLVPLEASDHDDGYERGTAVVGSYEIRFFRTELTPEDGVHSIRLRGDSSSGCSEQTAERFSWSNVAGILGLLAWAYVIYHLLTH